MKAILFGASGMVGQGVLRECLLDPNVEHVLSIVRKPSEQQHPKLAELVRKDLFAYSDIEPQLTGYNTMGSCRQRLSPWALASRPPNTDPR